MKGNVSQNETGEASTAKQGKEKEVHSAKDAEVDSQKAEKNSDEVNQNYKRRVNWCFCRINHGLHSSPPYLDDGDDGEYAEGNGYVMAMLEQMMCTRNGAFDEDAYDSIHGYRAFEMAALSGDVPSWVIDQYGM